MVHMANMVMGIAFGTAAAVQQIESNDQAVGHYCFVDYENIDRYNKPFEFPPQNERNDIALKRNGTDRFYRASAADFEKIPGSPIAYWVSEKVFRVFEQGKLLRYEAEPRLGMATGNNDDYLRLWYEVCYQDIGIGHSRQTAKDSKKKWFPYNKGGDFRRWYGNNDYTVNWYNDGYELQNRLHPSGKRVWAHNFNLDYIFKSSVTWTFVSSSNFGVRYSSIGFLFDVGGSSAFPSEENIMYILGFLASKVAYNLLKALNPTLNFQSGNIGDLPFLGGKIPRFTESIVKKSVLLSKTDWDS